ncbi:MAG: hypothetical protein J0H29_01060, partial [Sphingobacteriales bacterium]|nr:hypothetical protein [Sphingobacteriales bacterium]
SLYGANNGVHYFFCTGFKFDTATKANTTLASGFNKANPVYTFNPAGPSRVYQPNYSTASTWGLVLGLRYIFN